MSILYCPPNAVRLEAVKSVPFTRKESFRLNLIFYDTRSKCNSWGFDHIFRIYYKKHILCKCSYCFSVCPSLTKTTLHGCHHGKKSVNARSNKPVMAWLTTETFIWLPDEVKWYSTVSSTLYLYILTSRVSLEYLFYYVQSFNLITKPHQHIQRANTATTGFFFIFLSTRGPLWGLFRSHFLKIYRSLMLQLYKISG